MCVRQMRPPGRGDCWILKIAHAPSDKNVSKNGFWPREGVAFLRKAFLQKNFQVRERFRCGRLRSAAVTRLWPRGLRSSTPLGLTLSGASSSRSSAARPWLRYSRRTHSRRQRCLWLGSCIPVRPLARLVIIAARDRHRSRRATRSETRSCRDRSAHAARISRRV
jgi:hypothetical protein